MLVWASPRGGKGDALLDAHFIREGILMLLQYQASSKAEFFSDVCAYAVYRLLSSMKELSITKPAIMFFA